MIPKIIHYCWFGGKKLPKEVKKCIKSWKKYCPDYEIIEWNESNFDVTKSKFMNDAYNLKSWAFVSDYARLKIIYENGGIYLDTDVELVKSLDALLINDCYFAEQQNDNVVNTGLGFGSIKGHKIIKEMLDEYDSLIFDESKKNELACPHLNTNILSKHKYKYDDQIVYLKDINVIIYPPKFFDPLAPGKSKNLLCNDTFSIHHYSATWTNGKNKLKRKIFNFIGQDKIIKIKEYLRGEK